MEDDRSQDSLDIASDEVYSHLFPPRSPSRMAKARLMEGRRLREPRP
jgi:hypothetical protein